MIQLPSNYSGGQLMVYHQAKRMEFDFSGLAGCNNFQYAAFYADCQHEVKPVTKGHRLCLVYNLVYKGLGNCPSPTDNGQIVSTIVSSMREWNGEDPPMMTYLLEHKYCPASLNFQLLKNTDRAVADVLTQAKIEFQFDLYLAQVNLLQNWSASHGCGYYSDDYEEEELMDETVTAGNLKSLDGQCISSINLSKEFFVPEGFFDTVDPDEEEFEEATGNAGATLDKQYNCAALLLWPSINRTLNLGVTNVISLLEKNLPHQDQKTSEIVAKDLIRLIASGQWHTGCTEVYVSFLQSLKLLGNKILISEFLDVLASSISLHRCLIGSPSFIDQIISLGSTYGWNTVESSLKTIFDKVLSDGVEEYCKFLLKLSQPKSSDGQSLCQCLASSLLSVLANEDDTTSVSYYGRRDKGFVILLFKCLMTLECNEQLLSFVQVLCTKPNRYPVMDVLAPFCEDQYKSLKEEKNEALDHLLVYCISSLQASPTCLPSCPTDWTAPVPFSCSCTACVELIRFLRHPTETQHRFKMNMGRRGHLEHQLDRNKCSVKHVTECVGSPHTLVVTKTRAAYKEGCKKFKREKATLSRLQALTGASSSNGEPSVKRQKVIDLT